GSAGGAGAGLDDAGDGRGIHGVRSAGVPGGAEADRGVVLARSTGDRSGRDAAPGGGGVSAIRWAAGGGHGGAARAGRYADPDGGEPGGALDDRAAPGGGPRFGMGLGVVGIW